MNHPQSVAGAIFSLDRSKILLIKRRDVPVWVLPGGGIDPGESSNTAIAREILEETGFTVKINRLVGDYIPINRLAKRTHLFECEILHGKAQITEETSGIQFFSLKELPPMPPPYLEWILDARKEGPAIQKNLTSVNYRTFFKLFALHPLLVTRFMLARMGFGINAR